MHYFGTTGVGKIRKYALLHVPFYWEYRRAKIERAEYASHGFASIAYTKSEA